MSQFFWFFSLSHLITRSLCNNNVTIWQALINDIKLYLVVGPARSIFSFPWKRFFFLYRFPYEKQKQDLKPPAGRVSLLFSHFYITQVVSQYLPVREVDMVSNPSFFFEQYECNKSIQRIQHYLFYLLLFIHTIIDPL